MAFGNNFERKLEQVHERALKAVMDDLSLIPDYELDKVIPKCESPIERLLVEAICLFFNHRRLCDLGDCIGPSEFYGRLPVDGDDEAHDATEVNFIDTQVEVGSYRADIVVCRWNLAGPRGTKDCFKSPFVIIECDGHDFHERTKDQAKRDKSRDRFLQQEGYWVLRFTGSEIWQDAWGCAQQVSRFLSEKYRAHEGR